MLSAVTGFGGAAILLPVLVLMFGIRDAVPILTVTQLVGNGSRVWFNRREIHFPVVKCFLLGAVPAALSLPAIGIGTLLGPVMIAGSLLGKRLVDRVSGRYFSRLVDAAMIVVGVLFMIQG